MKIKKRGNIFGYTYGLKTKELHTFCNKKKSLREEWQIYGRNNIKKTKKRRKQSNEIKKPYKLAERYRN